MASGMTIRFINGANSEESSMTGIPEWSCTDTRIKYRQVVRSKSEEPYGDYVSF